MPAAGVTFYLIKRVKGVDTKKPPALSREAACSL
jgi:hypothetical protein